MDAPAKSFRENEHLKAFYLGIAEGSKEELPLSEELQAPQALARVTRSAIAPFAGEPAQSIGLLLRPGMRVFVVERPVHASDLSLEHSLGEGHLSHSPRLHP